MKKVLISLAVASLVTGTVGPAIAQQTTVVHKESADGVHSKTVVARDDGSKTIIKRGRHHMKKINIEANGDKTVVKKTAN